MLRPISMLWNVLPLLWNVFPLCFLVDHWHTHQSCHQWTAALLCHHSYSYQAGGNPESLMSCHAMAFVTTRHLYFSGLRGLAETQSGQRCQPVSRPRAATWQSDLQAESQTAGVFVCICVSKSVTLTPNSMFYCLIPKQGFALWVIHIYKGGAKVCTVQRCESCTEFFTFFISP